MNSTTQTTPEAEEWNKTTDNDKTVSSYINVHSFRTKQNAVGELQNVFARIHNERVDTYYSVKYSAQTGGLGGVKEESWSHGEWANFNQTTLTVLGFAHTALEMHFDVELDDPINYVIDGTDAYHGE